MGEEGRGHASDLRKRGGGEAMDGGGRGEGGAMGEREGSIDEGGEGA